MAREILVDIDALPRVTRRRLANSTGSMPALAPLCANPSSSRKPVFPWALLCLFCLGILILYRVVMSGFGHPGPDMLHPTGLVLLYCGATGWAVAAALVFKQRWSERLPFTPGRYLFPLDFVDARSRRLRIIPLSELSEVSAVHHRNANGAYSHSLVSLRFQDGTTESFSSHDGAWVEERVNTLRQVRAVLASAMEQKDERTVRAKDLFFEVRSQPGGFESLSRGSPVQAPKKRFETLRRVALACAISLVLGPSLWLVRNLLSDAAGFTAARTVGGPSALHAYTQTGWRHVDEAKELGWRTHFKDCEQQGTERCWKEFLEFWKESPRYKEAHDELLPRAALAESSRTVTRLRAFLSRYPGSVVEDEAKGRIHALFANALAEFQKEASPQNPQLVPFVSKLLAQLEATGRSTVVMRFHRRATTSLQRADDFLRKATDYGGGVAAPVYGHFDDAHTHPLESGIASALGSAFGRVFPNDLLTLEEGPALEEEPQALGPSSPEIRIDYTIGWSGISYDSPENNRKFVGIQFDFDVSMVLPEEKPLRFELTVKPPEHFSVQYMRAPSSPGGPGSGGLLAAPSRLNYPRPGSRGARASLGLLSDSGEWGSGGPSDSQVYSTMSQRAFDELGDKLGKVFFRSDSKALAVSRPGAP